MKVKFDDIVETLKQNKQKGEQAESRVKDLESVVGANDQVQAAIIGSIQVLIEFLAKETTKTEVTNHPKPVTSVKTPDISKVVDAVKSLNDTVAGKTVNLQPHLDTLEAIKTVLEGLPTDFPKFPDFPSSFKVDNLSDALKALDKIQKSIDKQKLDPKITVKPSDVKIDLKPLEKKIQKLIDKEDPVFPEIVIPENDNSDLKKAVQDVTAAINSLHFPVPNFRGEGIIEAINNAAGLVPESYDQITVTYVASGNGAGEIETVTYSKDASTVATLTLSYNSDNKLTGVVRS